MGFVAQLAAEPALSEYTPPIAPTSRNREYHNVADLVHAAIIRPVRHSLSAMTLTTFLSTSMARSSIPSS